MLKKLFKNLKILKILSKSLKIRQNPKNFDKASWISPKKF